MNEKIIQVEGNKISLFNQNENEYISLTDIAKKKNSEFAADVIKNWLRTKFIIDFLGTWEKIYNLNFKLVEFDQFKNEAGNNSFVIFPILKVLMLNILNNDYQK